MITGFIKIIRAFPESENLKLLKITNRDGVLSPRSYVSPSLRQTQNS